MLEFSLLEHLELCRRLSSITEEDVSTMKKYFEEPEASKKICGIRHLFLPPIDLDEFEELRVEINGK